MVLGEMPGRVLSKLPCETATASVGWAVPRVLGEEISPGVTSIDLKNHSAPARFGFSLASPSIIRPMTDHLRCECCGGVLPHDRLQPCEACAGASCGKDSQGEWRRGVGCPRARRRERAASALGPKQLEQDSRAERVTIRVASVIADLTKLFDDRESKLPTAEEIAEEKLAVQVAVRAFGRAFAAEHDRLSPNERRWINDRVRELARGMTP